MNIKWNAKDYTENVSFVHQYGEDVLSMLDVPEGGVVVRMGRGTGAVTGKLREKVLVDGEWISGYVRIRIRARKSL